MPGPGGILLHPKIVAELLASELKTTEGVVSRHQASAAAFLCLRPTRACSVFILVNPDGSLDQEPTPGASGTKMASDSFLCYKKPCSGWGASSSRALSSPPLPHPGPCLVPDSIRNAIWAANFTDWIHLNALMQRKHICLTLRLK